MRKIGIIFVAIAISVVISASCDAAEKRLALVIGNAAYQSSPLRNTINDANDMEKKLRQVGFDVIARINATQQDMEEAIREFGRKLSATDVGLFYFSGHGLQYKGENYLIPINDTGITDTNAKYKTVPMGVLLEEMTNAGNRLNIVILDACRNYPSSWSKTAVRGLAQMKANSGMLIAYATSLDSTASDNPSGRNGTYTANLLKYITNPGLHLLMFFQEVRKATLTDSGSQQRPWESVSITNDFYFVEAPAGQPVQPTSKLKYQIRKEPLTTDDPEKAFNLKKDKDGWLRPTEYFQNDFSDNGDGTITDRATGLMWQKLGIDKYVTYEECKAYIEEINKKKFAGYNDWHLSTIDELKSLLTPDKQSNDIYINPIFEKKEYNGFWSSDRGTHGYHTVWSIYFGWGTISSSKPDYVHYVRAVRSLK